MILLVASLTVKEYSQIIQLDKRHGAWCSQSTQNPKWNDEAFARKEWEKDAFLLRMREVIWSSWTSHLTTHIKEENFTCVQCNRSFGQAGSLKRHLLIPGLHNSFHPTIRDGGTWSGAHGEHADVFLFSNLGALWFSGNLIRYSLHVCLREVKNNLFSFKHSYLRHFLWRL